MLRLSCRDSVLADVSCSLGPVPAEQAQAYHLTREVYGTTRMLLACLSQTDLAKVGYYTCCACTVMPEWEVLKHDSQLHCPLKSSLHAPVVCFWDRWPLQDQHLAGLQWMEM